MLKLLGMKILITGAHFTPAQATIEELKKYSGIELIYLGRRHTLEGDKALSVESQILPKMGVKFYSLMAGRVRRYLSLQTVISWIKIPIGFIQAFLIVSKEQPGVVLSFGGYVAVPVVISAWLLNIPIITHEQTLVSGLANRICALLADKVAVSFEVDYKFPIEKTILTGNPIRSELINPKSEKFEHPLILIMGGNQGSHSINQAVLSCLGDLTKLGLVIHQTGDSKFKDFEKLSEIKQSLNTSRYQVMKWIDGVKLGSILKASDLCISRAGANSLSELAYFGVPTLVIPLPNLYQDEQNKNAKFFSELGLAKVLPQRELTGSKLLETVKLMLNDPNLKKKAKGAESVLIKDAARRLAQETYLLAK